MDLGVSRWISLVHFDLLDWDVQTNRRKSGKGYESRRRSA